MNIIHLYHYIWILYIQIFKIFECSVKIRQIPHVRFELTSQFLSNYGSFVIVMAHNSPVNFKLIHFLLWIKWSNMITWPSSETLEFSGENLPNSLCHFPNHKSFFLQILHLSTVSRKITLLYFFSSKIIYFGQIEPIKFLRLSSAWSKIHRIPHVYFESASQFLLKFIILQCYYT